MKNYFDDIDGPSYNPIMAKKENQNLGTLVRAYRLKANLTQLQLSKILGYETAQFVSLFERGESKIPMETAGQLVSILGIPEAKVKKMLLADFEREIAEKIKAGKAKGHSKIA